MCDNILGCNSFIYIECNEDCRYIEMFNLLPYGVSSRLHLSRKRLGETMSKVSNLKDAKYGQLDHVYHIQDSNGKWYKTK
jgi:hypothetical protein